MMMFDRNIIMLWIPGGRVIDEANRIPLFLITLQEPLPGADDSDRARFPVGLSGAASAEEALERGTFFGRRDDAEGVRVDEALPGEGRI